MTEQGLAPPERERAGRPLAADQLDPHDPAPGKAPKSSSSLKAAGDNRAAVTTGGGVAARLSRRALPSTVIDAIRDGASPAELRARGDRAVFSLLVSTAMSAQQRGWPYSDWQALLSGRDSHLGWQVWMRRGRTERSPKDFNHVLGQAWDRAEKLLTEAPPAFGNREVLAYIAAFRKSIAGLDLPEEKRAILVHAADEGERLGTTRPALPRMGILQRTRLGLTALRTALAQLDRDGLLVLTVRGRPGGPSARRQRANCYQLGPALGLHIPVPEVWPVVPPATSAASEANHVVPPSPAEANHVVPPTALAGKPCGALKTDNGERVGDPPGPQVSEAPEGDMPACRVCGAKLPPGHILCTRVCADTYYRRWAAA
jgi:hypothetical protein